MIATFETRHVSPYGRKLGLQEGAAYYVRGFSPLGRGGNGEVFRVCINTGTHDSVFALKCHQDSTTLETARAEWFTHVYVGDAHGHAALPYALGELCMDYGITTRKNHAYLMELAAGDTLLSIVEYLSVRGPLDAQTCARFGSVTAQAVSALHACGITHRDLAPENIVGVYDEATRSLTKSTLLDFGVAASPTDRLTPGNWFRIAHLNYAPAEVFQPVGVGFGDARFRPSVDVWSIGALLYWMYTLTAPNDQEISAVTSPSGLVDWVRLTEIKRPGLSLPPALVGMRAPDLALSELVHDCTAFDPADRPSIDEVIVRLIDLERIQVRTPIYMVTPVRNA